MLEEDGIKISVDGKDLVLRVGEAGLSQSLRERILRNKPEIISHLIDEGRAGNSGMPFKESPEPVSKDRRAMDTNPDRSVLDTHRSCRQPVIACFENQCRVSPRSTALEFDGHRIDYQTLNKKADDIARYISLYDIRSSDIVAVFMDRSMEMVACLLAIFKIGATYLPIDSGYPKERILYILEDSQAKAIVVQGNLERQLPGTYASVISLDDMMTTDSLYAESQNSNSAACECSMNSSAYIIYTSGSTGAPKGVEICHESFANVMTQIIDELELGSSDAFLAMASISFDISLFELIAPLMIGARILLLDDYQCKDPAYIASVVQTEQVTVLQATPAMWMLLNHYDWHGSERNIKVISTGEALSRELAGEISDRSNAVWNLYGPTETSVWATIKRIQREEGVDGGGTYVPIGRPLKNYTTYILDRLLQPVPVGVLGELYIGGVGLAKGYVGKQSLTSERFVERRAPDGSIERQYKTGDLVRYMDNRDIEYVRRMDNQVKINGYRIELGEIEAILKGHMSISDAVVDVTEMKKSGINRIIAYVVPEKNMPNKTSETLTKHLSQYLPNYMLPHRYMFIDKVPLSGSGKVDRKALPVPEMIGEGEYVEPRDDIEATIADIYCDILEIDKIGIYDNFFDMGGSSMLAATLLIPINAEYDLDLSLRDILSVPPTVSNVAALVREHESIAEQAMDP